MWEGTTVGIAADTGTEMGFATVTEGAIGKYRPQWIGGNSISERLGIPRLHPARLSSAG